MHRVPNLWIGLCYVLFAIQALWASDNRRPVDTFRIVGYLPDYRFAEFREEQAEGLTDLVIFSAAPAPDGPLDTAKLSNCPWQTLQELKARSGIRLIVAVGGWERSEHFAKVVSSAELRARFVHSALQLCKERQLDGIDLDWEHPQNDAEESSYGLLLADLRRAFEPVGLRVSVTVAAWQTLVPQAIEAADAVQLMAYDHEGQHSTFDGAVVDVQKMLKQGVPSNKLLLGVPFYGRDVTTRQAMTYRDIVAKLKPRRGSDQVDSIYFNSSETIAKKVRYARQSGMSGVMIWEIGQDAKGEDSLLRSISKLVKEGHGQ